MNDQYLNKYFYQQYVPYKIINVTSKFAIYKQCKRDYMCTINNCAMYDNMRIMRFSHFSKIVDVECVERKNLLSTLPELFDDIDDNIYNIDIINYDNVDLFNNGMLSTPDTIVKSNYYNLILFTSKTIQDIYLLKRNFDTYMTLDNVIKSKNNNHVILISEYKLDLDIIIKKISELINSDDRILNKMYEHFSILSDKKYQTIINIANDKYPIKTKITKIDDCPICLDNKECKIGYFNCSHSLCVDCYKSLNKKICMFCRSS